MPVTILWLVIWACNSFPQLHAWNSWLVALIVMAAVDFGGGLYDIGMKHAKRGRL